MFYSEQSYHTLRYPAVRLVSCMHACVCKGVRTCISEKWRIDGQRLSCLRKDEATYLSLRIALPKAKQAGSPSQGALTEKQMQLTPGTHITTNARAALHLRHVQS